jgi:hypothetical protein
MIVLYSILAVLLSLMGMGGLFLTIYEKIHFEDS